MTDKMIQTQLVHVIYLQGVATSCKQITRSLVVTDSFYLSFVTVSNTTGMAHLTLKTPN